MTRHLTDVHAKEPEVIMALIEPKGSFKRRSLLEKLSRRGDYYNNIKVLEMKSGQLRLLRNPTCDEMSGRSYNDYGPCPGCLGFVIKTDLWRHCQRCEHYRQSTEIKHGQIQRDSRLLLIGEREIDSNDDFSTKVLACMAADDISSVAKSDWLITRLGHFIFQKHGASQKKLICQYMRIMARLLIIMREENKSVAMKLEDSLKPERFDLVVKAVHKLALKRNTERDHPEFDSPSLALKVGHHLMKCALILKGKALRTRNTTLEKNASVFISLPFFSIFSWLPLPSLSIFSWLPLPSLSIFSWLPLSFFSIDSMLTRSTERKNYVIRFSSTYRLNYVIQISA